MGRGILVISFITLGLISYANVIHIPGDQPCIQAGIDRALPGDTILVAEGTYYENINFRGKAIMLTSHYILTEDTSHISKTIINGSRPFNPDTASTVLMVSGEDSTSILCGFTITGGSGTIADLIDNRDRAGGGIFINQNGGRIDHNIIQGNAIDYKQGIMIQGGGIYAGLPQEGNYSFVCRRNIIRDNILASDRATQGGGIIVNGGKGNVLICYNQITSNKIFSTGKRQVHGGGVSIRTQVPYQGSLIVRDNIISDNELHGHPTPLMGSEEARNYNPVSGGGIIIVLFETASRHLDLNPYPLVCNNTIRNNYTNGRGGGIAVGNNFSQLQDALISPKPLIINNIITGNRAADGSGIINNNGIVLLADNHFRDNSSEREGNEFLNIGNGVLYSSKNDYKGKWSVQKVLRTGDRLILRSKRQYFRIDGIELRNPLYIEPIPPLWRIWWAFIIYGFIIILFFFWYRSFLLKRARLKTAVEVERIEKEKVKEIDQLKSRFFANISHEFRTPLTLLIGPLDDLLRQEQKKQKLDPELIHLMRNNALRLQRLINQLLDLSKLETGKMKLEVEDGDLTNFVRRIVLSFLSLAESKKIKYTYDLPESPTMVHFDADKIEKILTNLISNAFKFTQDEGEIHVILKYKNDEDHDLPSNIDLLVMDNGKGIPEDQIDRVFDRFYQVSSSEVKEEEGTGIGLSLTRELVEVYRGEINVESKQGEGSVFTVTLPVSKEQFSNDEIKPASLTKPDLKSYDDPGTLLVEMNKSEIPKTGKPVKDIPIVLIVEDNIDLRNYIAQNLGTYQILEAEDGRMGLKKAIETIPDLVISDLMMPEMDGMEMCGNLKTDSRTSHIPIILLTAKADRNSKLEGLDIGADDYIIKPFDPEELRVRVKNLIEQRRRLRDRYRKEFLADTSNIELSAPEEEFLLKVMKCIENHISDPDFNVEKLGSELHLSRVQVYRKILAVTDHTPLEFIRNTRLRLSARMFREGHKNVSKVMYEVGFSTPSHFTNCFRELFGVNPSEYIKNF